ncbi:MAG: hypothetical protein JWQ39_322 [Glaciihabitans sp.]|nr:hypothetical protein [Glaciihabitans sp.]
MSPVPLPSILGLVTIGVLVKLRGPALGRDLDITVAESSSTRKWT